MHMKMHMHTSHIPYTYTYTYTHARRARRAFKGLFEVTTYYKLLCIFYDKKMHQVHDTFERQSHDSTEFLLGAGL
jgi:hypothetical protein